MTDNVVKAGIEDVLSSVKRLVSEEGRKGSESDDKTATRKPGRLVLTDALLISKPAKAEQGDEPQKPEAEYSAEDSAKPMLLRACDIVRAGTAANQDEAEVPTALEASEEQPESAESEDLTGSLSAKIEALEAAIARTEDQWEPDGESDDAYSGTPTQSMSWALETGFVDADGEDPDDPDAVVTSDETQADEGPQQATATFVRDPDVATPSDLASEEDQDQDEPGSLTMKEEALRDLIADVVRQELQGALGERITRNLRKMVRREIQRALAAQKLD